MTRNSRSVADTRRLGATFASRLAPGDIVALEGDLGSGKTEFVRGACKALGVPDDVVTSPTFTIVNEYSGEGTTVFHIDAYRLKTESEFFDLGYEDYLSGQAIVFIEWPERVSKTLAGGEVIWIRFQHDGENRRTIYVEG